MSYMTATFMIEAMATANAYVRHKARERQSVVVAQSPTIQTRNSTDRVSRCVCVCGGGGGGGGEIYRMVCWGD
jgi:hypothetical protein